MAGVGLSKENHGPTAVPRAPDPDVLEQSHPPALLPLPAAASRRRSHVACIRGRFVAQDRHRTSRRRRLLRTSQQLLYSQSQSLSFRSVFLHDLPTFSVPESVTLPTSIVSVGLVAAEGFCAGAGISQTNGRASNLLFRFRSETARRPVRDLDTRFGRYFSLLA